MALMLHCGKSLTGWRKSMTVRRESSLKEGKCLYMEEKLRESVSLRKQLGKQQLPWVAKERKVLLQLGLKCLTDTVLALLLYVKFSATKSPLNF